MSFTLIILLIILGLLLVLVEIFLLPGTTVVGIAGGLLITFSIWQAYRLFGSSTGHLVVLATFIMIGITLFTAFKTKTWNRMMLHANIEGRVNDINTSNIHVGDEGKAVSRISPAGTALINGDLYEVHTKGDFIDQETEIIISKLEDNKIFVKRK